jgi:hypothetical protein
VTRDDAQLLFDWLCRHYGYPGELERVPCKTLADRDDNQRRHNAERKPKPRRDNNRQQDQPTRGTE